MVRFEDVHGGWEIMPNYFNDLWKSFRIEGTVTMFPIKKVQESSYADIVTLLSACLLVEPRLSYCIGRTSLR